MQLALFDFDHTLTDRDSYGGFLRRIATPEQRAQAKWTLGPWLFGYRLGLVSARGLRARATRTAFAGRDATKISAQAESYAQDELPTMLRAEMMHRLESHHAQGHELVLVSASLDLYLRPWCERYGIGLICNRLESEGGRLTGRYAGDDIGPHKAREIRARYDLAKYERIHAYGDSSEDRPMLALAHVRWYQGRPVD